MHEIFGDFTGAAIRLDKSAFETIADMYDLDIATLRAVLSVESSGSGFDGDGRPKILFEPHVFYRLLDPVKREYAIDDGLAYHKWGMRPYPPGSDAQYDRLTRAMKIDQTRALQSCSWGLGQIMGFNHDLAGYGDVETMVLAAMDSEPKQLEMMMQFIKSSGLLGKLRSKDWAGFARGYNGPGFSKNRYDEKLAEAYRRFADME